MRQGISLSCLAVWAALAAAQAPDGPLVQYDFTAGEGTIVADGSGHAPALDLVIDNPAAVRWGAGSLTITGPTTIATAGPATRLLEAVRAAGQFAVEVWLETASETQAGPARVVTMSVDAGQRNFTVGQQQQAWDVRFRTTRTGPNGSSPSTTYDPVAANTAPDVGHVVYTRSKDGTAILYVDGKQVARQEIPGSLASWDPSYPLCLANEVGDERPWSGGYHLVAIYDAALSAAEVAQHHTDGLAALADQDIPDLVREPVALYAFDEGNGVFVRDQSTIDPALDLTIEDPALVEWRDGSLLVKPGARIVSGLAAEKIHSRCAASEEITIEAWVRPADLRQEGPARIVSLSADGMARNATLGQSGDGFVVRLRTNTIDPNGASPELHIPRSVPTVALPSTEPPATGPQHLLYTFDGSVGRIYLNGRLRSETDLGGQLDNWEPMRLALGNELTGDRPWRGTLHRVAIWSRALSETEVAARQAAGPTSP